MKKRVYLKESRYKTLSEIPDIPDLVRLWLFRLLVPLGAQREFIKENCFGDEGLARILGLEEWIDAEDRDFDQKAIRAQLRKLHHKFEKSFRHAAPPKALADNIVKLSCLVGLSDTDCRILELTTLMYAERIMGETATMLGLLSSLKIHYVLSVLLHIPVHDIRTALSPKGVLACSGLVTVDKEGPQFLENKLTLLTSDFADTILCSDADPVTLLSEIVFPSKPGTLSLADFVHITPSLKILLPYLRHVLATRRQGVNIFLHGAPGTGKSELSRLLAKEMGCELFEVANEAGEGNPLSGDHRLRAFSAAQSFFSQRRAIILFDEVEDVFDNWDSFLGHKSKVQSRKAWINRMLEGNPVPAVWVSNSVDCVDPAFIRRFDIVINLPSPPKRQLKSIVHGMCGDMLPAELINKITKTDNLTPAIITRAVSVVKSIQGELAEEDIPKIVEHLIGNTLEAQGYRRLDRYDSDRLPSTYDPAFINADSDLVVVADGLANTKSGRLCLYGAPGTGKTAFGRWLADRLDVPLCIKRASDLLGKYVGETEHNIAEAFREAKKDCALLLIDEVDSFLQDRRRAHRSWEVTAVNEMLTQMESFSGVFIASTNLMDGLDQAALRRFDLKVKFDFLKPEQAWRLFKKHCKILGLPLPKQNLKTPLARLSVITPGDFATVARQNRFLPITTPSGFISALEQECQIKEDGHKKSLGFF